MNRKTYSLVLLVFLFTIPHSVYAKMYKKWEWTGSIIKPAYKCVWGTPLILNITDDNMDSKIDLDDIPDIIFISNLDSVVYEGILRAISGLDGNEIFTITDPRYYCAYYADKVAGDIDGDGLPEIVAIHGDGMQPIAFEHDGTFKWLGTSTTRYPRKMIGSVEIADLDSDGNPEIIFGATVWNSDGTLKWEGSYGMGGSSYAQFSTCAALNRDEKMKVIAGNTFYRYDGSVYWRNTSLFDGYTSSIADFDLDGDPEILLIDDFSKLWLLNHDGSIQWGPIP